MNFIENRAAFSDGLDRRGPLLNTKYNANNPIAAIRGGNYSSVDFSLITKLLDRFVGGKSVTFNIDHSLSIRFSEN